MLVRGKYSDEEEDPQSVSVSQIERACLGLSCQSVLSADCSYQNEASLGWSFLIAFEVQALQAIEVVRRQDHQLESYHECETESTVPALLGLEKSPW